ncbi:hypothetical protein E2C01_035044 [Portunus trituberculatus]|uniref:Uncharacterized protein n=1 Tax=Portunus trituberculatus TaxID=210409 RepID=A0A5B7F343_PORTR|nr:hypothetical protein [Portunus trituberculatus]
MKGNLPLRSFCRGCASSNNGVEDLAEGAAVPSWTDSINAHVEVLTVIGIGVAGMSHCHVMGHLGALKGGATWRRETQWMNISEAVILTQLSSSSTIYGADIVTLFYPRVVVHKGQTVGTQLFRDHIVHTLVVFVTLLGVCEKAIGQRALRDNLLLLGRCGELCILGTGPPLTLGCGRTRALLVESGFRVLIEKRFMYFSLA